MYMNDLKEKKLRGEKITSITAYDYSFARVADEAGFDIILVGDSLGNVVLGYDTTIPVSIDDMEYHTRAVSRGTRNGLLISDMPFMTYSSTASALANAAKLMQAGAQMVKLEGGEWLSETVNQLSKCGIPVCAHLGLTPQSIHKIGGFKMQGSDETSANTILSNAINLEQAGAELLVVECVPSSLGKTISERLSIPVIGIGAGADTDGQILVMYDLLGLSPQIPSFSKNFLRESSSISDALIRFGAAIRDGSFPKTEQTDGS
jgi:3-methyl-2-oxobutanoate hydroxymethyltransferase